jgi:hypothetical protein
MRGSGRYISRKGSPRGVAGKRLLRSKITEEADEEGCIAVRGRYQGA